MFKRKKTYSIEEAFSLIQSLETKCDRMPELLGFKSLDICKSYKQLLTHCNSLVIVFIQYNLLNYASRLLKSAEKADSCLLRYALHSDKIWSGRVLTFTNEAYLSYK